MKLSVETAPSLAISQLRNLENWEEIKESGHAEIVIEHGVGKIELTVDLAHDHTPFGKRTYFSCPQCESSRKALYLVDGQFLCRGCHGLLYFKQLLPGSKWRSDVAYPLASAKRGLGWRTV